MAPGRFAHEMAVGIRIEAQALMNVPDHELGTYAGVAVIDAPPMVAVIGISTQAVPNAQRGGGPVRILESELDIGVLVHLARRPNVEPNGRLSAVLVGNLAQSQKCVNAALHVPKHQHKAFLPPRIIARGMRHLIRCFEELDPAIADHFHVRHFPAIATRR